MRVPLWVLVLSVLLAITWQEMASLVLKRSFLAPLARGGGVDIKRSSFLPSSVVRTVNCFLNHNNATPSHSHHFGTTTSKMASKQFLDTIKARRTYYAL